MSPPCPARTLGPAPSAAPLAVLVACAIGAACEPIADDLDFARQDVPIFRAATLQPAADLPAPGGLRVAAWNIKYGAGRTPFWFDCWGDQVALDRATVEANLREIAALIDELQLDVVMLEEIEVNSRRSAYIDMVQWLLDHTRMNYGAYFETWNARYVPSEGLGRMALGNAILTRHRPTRAERIRQADRTDQDAVTATFYLHRTIGRLELRVAPTRSVVAMVVHTEAYDNDGTKQKQIKQIHQLALAETAPLVVGGDFNELPPTAVRRQGFPDERETAVCAEDFAQPPYTPEVMQPLFDELVPWLALARLGTTEASQARYFTHSVLGPDEVNEAGIAGDWNRTLDYLFARNASWIADSSDVLQRKGQRVGAAPATGPDQRQTLVADPLRLSDHAPVFGVLEVP